MVLNAETRRSGGSAEFLNVRDLRFLNGNVQFKRGATVRERQVHPPVKSAEDAEFDGKYASPRPGPHLRFSALKSRSVLGTDVGRVPQTPLPDSDAPANLHELRQIERQLD